MDPWMEPLYPIPNHTTSFKADLDTFKRLCKTVCIVNSDSFHKPLNKKYLLEFHALFEACEEDKKKSLEGIITGSKDEFVKSRGKLRMKKIEDGHMMMEVKQKDTQHEEIKNYKDATKNGAISLGNYFVEGTLHQDFSDFANICPVWIGKRVGLTGKVNGGLVLIEKCIELAQQTLLA